MAKKHGKSSLMHQLTKHTPTRMAQMKNINMTKYHRGYSVVGMLLHAGRGACLVQPLWKIVWHYLPKFIIHISMTQPFHS